VAKKAPMVTDPFARSTIPPIGADHLTTAPTPIQNPVVNC
jgi:hypothetical protein